jgi:hypothetical protein
MQSVETAPSAVRSQLRSVFRPLELPLLGVLGLAVIAHVFATASLIAQQTVTTSRGLYFVLEDDAMIAMTYARNLAHGHGLIFGPGPRVEGFTNFLWVVWMAFLHVLRIPTADTSLAVMVSNILIDAAIAFVLVRLVGHLLDDRRAKVAVVILFLFAQRLDFLLWAIKGFETSLVALALLVSIERAIKTGVTKAPAIGGWLVATIVLFLARGDTLPLVAASALSMGVALAICDRGSRRRFVAAVGGLLGVIVIGFVARRLYYGAWLPNTYYLKATGYPLHTRISLGRAYTRGWVDETWPLWLPPVLYAAFCARAPRRLLPFALLVPPFIAQLVYAVYVGGDVFSHYRFFTAIFPIVCAGAAVAVVGTWDLLLARRGLISEAVLTAIVLLIAVHPGPGRYWQSYKVQTGLSISPAKAVWPDTWLTDTGLWLHDHTRPGTTVAVFQAGTIPYFSDRPSYDLLGKADAHIAHMTVNPDNGDILGHNKFDFAYSLAKRPDIVVTDIAEPGVAAGGIDPYTADTFRLRAHGAYSFVAKIFFAPQFRAHYVRNQLALGYGPFVFFRDSARHKLVGTVSMLSPRASAPTN